MMKKYVFFVAGLILLTSSSVTAEPTHPNEVGLYTEPSGYGDTGTYVQGAPVNVYLVLTKPTRVSSDGGPCKGVGAFEVTIFFNPIGGIFKLAEVFPGEGINIGDTNNIQDGYLEYIVGFDGWLPVIDEAFTLVSLTFLNINTSTVAVTLGPSDYPSIPGKIVFVPEVSQLEIMYPVSGSFDDPVFLFNGMAVGVENESFGSVKALFR